MLVVLSEINCLETLKAKHVYPNEFYTDLEEFKNKAAFFREATVLVIFAGNCHFNKRHTMEFARMLMKRLENEKDSGIKHVYIVSDMTLAGVRSYYRYTGCLDTVDIMHGWKVARTGVDIWKKLATEECETVCHLSSYDRGDISDIIEQYKQETSVKDEYQELIHVPNLREMLGTA